ncbi:hypothetical protein EGW08_004831 [Elysia chlorotica]|uniref:Fibronectin type-III domain-containing protein n=1 Tax=Elysia chlorotica TaxID=188477 RepID=A0A433U0P7_ELYCH|nr:hypothetical protein EGW08_004831 [Elysia chlorotica]
MAGILRLVILLYATVCAVLGSLDELKPRITYFGFRHSTAFLVNWEKPRKLNDNEIVRYEVATWMKNFEDQKMIVSTSPNKTSLVVMSLAPYTEYIVQVTAVTRMGRGPPSDPSPVLTDTAPPTTPLGLTISQITPRSVSLQWEQPEIFYRSIDSYEVELFSGGLPLRTLSTEDTKITVEDLTPGQDIVVRLCAVTKSVFGNANYEGESVQISLRTPLEAMTRSSEIPTTTSSEPPSTRVTTMPPGTTPTTTSRPRVVRGRKVESLASRTALAKLNWLRTGTRDQLAQARLANLQAEVAILQKIKLELEIAKLRRDL